MSCCIEDGRTISLTRGDTFSSEVHAFIKETQEEYVPIEGDTVRFALKRNAVKSDRSGFMDDEPLIEKNIPIGTMILELDPEDTQGLPFGEYAYDIELTHANGRVDTFIADAIFNICREVH